MGFWEKFSGEICMSERKVKISNGLKSDNAGYVMISVMMFVLFLMSYALNSSA